MIRHAPGRGLAAKLGKAGSLSPGPGKRRSSAPNPGAGTQASIGAVTAGARRKGTSTDARSQVDPIAGAKGQGYVQRDPEGGLRQVNVYKVNGQRIVRAFTRHAPVPPDVLKHLAQSPDAAQRAAQAALKRTGTPSGKGPPGQQARKFNRGKTRFDRGV